MILFWVTHFLMYFKRFKIFMNNFKQLIATILVKLLIYQLNNILNYCLLSFFITVKKRKYNNVTVRKPFTKLERYSLGSAKIKYL